MHSTRRTAVAGALLLSLCLPALAGAGQFRFVKSRGIAPLEILSSGEFELRFGGDAQIPRSDEAVVALAQRLFPPHWVRQPDVAQPERRRDDDCGEQDVGRLFAALANPAISDAARQAVDALYENSAPLLPHTYTAGKFKVFYTDHNSNPDHNVALADVQRLATYLNNDWTRYVSNGGFREPKHWHWLGQPRIDVRVYYLGSNLAGQTHSSWIHIDLNSRTAVRDLCRVKTVPAHELFHRVQYSYEYRSGTANMGWIVEGTASWAQRFTHRTVGDYMVRMNDGLLSPDRNLISSRSYDAAHLWVFLQQRADPYRATPIRQVWQNYATNGRNAKAALNSYTTSTFGADFPFNAFVAWWHRANLFKDFANAAPDYEYSDDEWDYTSCGETYGPLAHVPRVTGEIETDDAPRVSFTRFVAANGADYYEYTLGAGLTHVRVAANGQAGKSFTYIFSRSKSNRWLNAFTRTAEDYTYDVPLVAGDNDRLQITVVGNTGGNYTLTIGP